MSETKTACDWCEADAAIMMAAGNSCAAHRRELERVVEDRARLTGQPFAGEVAEAEVSRAAATLGRKGGLAGRGASQRRGGDTPAQVSAHYRAVRAARDHISEQDLSRLSCGRMHAGARGLVPASPHGWYACTGCGDSRHASELTQILTGPIGPGAIDAPYRLR